MSGPGKGSLPPLLEPAQARFLEAFFRIEKRFFLTGGAALGGFHLRHRRSKDVDLFTPDATAMADLPERLPAVLAVLGWEGQTARSSPTFQRVIANGPGEEVRVDLVFDPTTQAEPVKPVFDGIRVDDMKDICANKICAVIGRIEPRDYTDLFFLERAGYRVEDHIGLAFQKDGGVEAATLAELLKSARVHEIPPLMAVPLDLGDLNRFIADLSARLARLAFPGGKK